MRQFSIRKIIIYTAAFIASVLILMGALVLSAMIPRAALRDNMLSSAELLCEHPDYYNLIETVPATQVHNYADIVLLNIAYHFDESDPLRSVMLAEYYYEDGRFQNASFLNSIKSSPEPSANTQYLRYWHGSAGLARLSHLFTNIHGMHIICAVIITALTILLLYLLIRRKLYAGAVGTAAAFIMAGIWMVPFTLEYSWVFIISLTMSVIAVKLVRKDKPETLGIAFMICGIITNYLDFLTCETLTLLIPLLLAVYMRRERAIRDNILFSVKNTVLWGVGYVGMWVTKWIAAAAVLGEDVMPYITGHIAERIAGSGQLDTLGYITESLLKNLSCLFPYSYHGAGIVVSIVIALGLAYVCFVYRRKGANYKLMLLYAIIGLVPYIRFTVLHGHSYGHYFFTYRAQAAAVLAVCLIIYELIGGRGNVKRKRT